MLAIAGIAASAAVWAGGTSHDFVGPGLWRIVYDTHGPMGMHTLHTQFECWTPDGAPRDGGWLLPDGPPSATATPQPAGQGHWVYAGTPGTQYGPAGMTYAVHNAPLQSTVDVHGAVVMPQQGSWSMHDHKVFSEIGSVSHAYTVSGQGGSIFSKTPSLDETWTERGQRIATTCPVLLPAGSVSTLQPAQIPALQALQKLSRQMQAQDPHPNGG